MTETEKQIEVLKSKFFLTDVCFEKAVETLQILVRGSSDKKLVPLFNNLRNQICTSYVAMSQMQLNVASDLTQAKNDFENQRLEYEQK